MNERTVTLSVADDIAEDDHIRRLVGVRVQIGQGTVRIAFPGPDWSAFRTDRRDEDGNEVWEIRAHPLDPS